MTKRRRRRLPLTEIRARRAIVGMSLALLLEGCASSNSGLQLASQPADAAAPPATTSYTLSPEERGLDCKKLTGRMQVRILQIRDFAERPQTTEISRSLQGAAIPIFGGSMEGADPNGRYKRDRAMLEAYNAELAAKGCPTFDLDAELTPKPTSITPVPAAKK